MRGRSVGFTVTVQVKHGMRAYRPAVGVMKRLKLMTPGKAASADRESLRSRSRAMHTPSIHADATAAAIVEANRLASEGRSNLVRSEVAMVRADVAASQEQINATWHDANDEGVSRGGDVSCAPRCRPFPCPLGLCLWARRRGEGKRESSASGAGRGHREP